MSVFFKQLPAAENPVKMGKTTAAGPRRGALGEITNFPGAAVNTKVTETHYGQKYMDTLVPKSCGGFPRRVGGRLMLMFLE